MKKIVLFVFSFTRNHSPSKEIIFKKEVPESILPGTVYSPFGNELRAGAIQDPHKIIEQASGEPELQMTVLYELPFERINQEELDYIRRNMKKAGWTLFSDNTNERN